MRPAPVQAQPAPSVRASPRLPPLSRPGVRLPAWLPSAAMRMLDWVVVLAAASAAALWSAGLGLIDLPIGQAIAFLGACAALKAGLWLTESYAVSPVKARHDQTFGGLALGVLAGIGAAAAIAPDAKAASALAAVLPISALLMAGLHAALLGWTRAAERAGYFSEQVVLVGATDAARRFATRAARHGDARVVATVDDRRTPRHGEAACASLEDLLCWRGLPHVDRILLAVPSSANARVTALLARLRPLPQRIDLLLDYEPPSVRGRDVQQFAGAPVVRLAGIARDDATALARRCFDVFIAGIVLAALALPMALAAIAVVAESGAPALRRQRCFGRNNASFDLLRFRIEHGDGAPTRLGALLRHTGAEAWPHWLNVLGGQMSVVGPRPHPVSDPVPGFANFAHRHRVKPGLVSLARLRVGRGGARALARRRLRLDLDYAAHASLWLDVKVLALAVRTALTPR